MTMMRSIMRAINISHTESNVGDIDDETTAQWQQNCQNIMKKLWWLQWYKFYDDGSDDKW